MAITRIMPQPGVVKDDPEYAAQGVWTSTDKVRFRLGKPEKIGGYENYINTSMIGIARGMHVWDSFDDDRFMGIGTEQRLYIENGGELFDKTPLRTSSTSTPVGTASHDLVSAAGNGGWIHVDTDGTSRVVATGHGAGVGDWVAISSAGTVSVSGGSCSIVPNGVHQIVSVSGADEFFIVLSATTSGVLNAETTAAGGSGTPSADQHLDYLLPSGTSEAANLFGWGIDGWGSGGWGEAATESSVQIALRSWNFDNAGEDLFANPRGGGIYFWDKSSAIIASTSLRATYVSATNSPSSVENIFVTPERHMVALGANNVDTDGNGSANLMRVQWSDQEIFFGADSWQPLATNTAGDQVLQGGSRLIAGLAVRGINLIWSDAYLFQMAFTGPPFTFGFQRLGKGGLIAPKAVAEENGRAFWMSHGHFHVWSGGAPQNLECPVRDFVFDRLDSDNADKIICHINEKFSEVWWDYPSLDGSGENDSYVVYNFETNTWFIGTFERTAIANNTKDETTFAVHSDKRLMQHEGKDIYDAENSAMGARIISAPMDIGDGDSIALMHTLIPDVQLSGGRLLIKTKSRRYPQAELITRSSSSFDTDTRKLDIRAAGRQIQFEVESTGTVGVNWRLGDMRADIKQGGGR